MKEYVVGFALSEDGRKVLLIQKHRPEYLAGYWCGIGGKVEPGETPEFAMAREALEEAGLPARWERYTSLAYGDRWIHFFAATCIDLKCAHARTDEPIDVFPVDVLPLIKIIPNLRFLVPMAVHHALRERFVPQVIPVYGQGTPTEDRIAARGASPA